MLVVSEYLVTNITSIKSGQGKIHTLSWLP